MELQQFIGWLLGLQLQWCFFIGCWIKQFFSLTHLYVIKSTFSFIVGRFYGNWQQILLTCNFRLYQNTFFHWYTFTYLKFCTFWKADWREVCLLFLHSTLSHSAPPIFSQLEARTTWFPDLWVQSLVELWVSVSIWAQPSLAPCTSWVL